MFYRPALSAEVHEAVFGVFRRHVHSDHLRKSLLPFVILHQHESRVVISIDWSSCLTINQEYSAPFHAMDLVWHLAMAVDKVFDPSSYDTPTGTS
jgi:hypothetical protein